MQETFNQALKGKKIGLVRADSGFYNEELLMHISGLIILMHNAGLTRCSHNARGTSLDLPAVQ